METAGWWTERLLWTAQQPSSIGPKQCKPSCGGYIDAKNLTKKLANNHKVKREKRPEGAKAAMQLVL